MRLGRAGSRLGGGVGEGRGRTRRSRWRGNDEVRDDSGDDEKEGQQPPTILRTYSHGTPPSPPRWTCCIGRCPGNVDTSPSTPRRTLRRADWAGGQRGGGGGGGERR